MHEKMRRVNGIGICYLHTETPSGMYWYRSGEAGCGVKRCIDVLCSPIPSITPHGRVLSSISQTMTSSGCCGLGWTTYEWSSATTTPS